MKEYFLTLLRNRETDTMGFRFAANALSDLIVQEIGAHMQLEKCTIATPLGTAQGAAFTHRVILVSILRAGLVLLPSFLHLFPKSPIGFFGIRRDEQTALPHLYYENIPTILPQDQVFLLDPMLATGGTAHLALERLEKKGATPSKITLVTFLAAREGFETIRKRHSQIRIFTVAVDEALNQQKFIVPGLGDFGDRYFG